MRPSLDAYFLAMLPLVAGRGTCPRRQVACILTDQEGRMVSMGYSPCVSMLMTPSTLNDLQAVLSVHHTLMMLGFSFFATFGSVDSVTGRGGNSAELRVHGMLRNSPLTFLNSTMHSPLCSCSKINERFSAGDNESYNTSNIIFILLSLES